MAEVMDSVKLNVQCTYPDCTKYFETTKDMKRHKVKAPEHNYCKKCDVDCQDWKHLTQHKVDAMMPWLEGRMKHNPDESPMHIVCEFCGEDFKSFGGRKLHRQQNHKADQQVKCPGCEIVFNRAGSYVEHLEKGQCKFITQRMFQSSIQHKQVVKQLLSGGGDPGIGGNDTPGLIVEPSETQDTEAGGIALLDQEDDAQKGGYKPLQPEVDLVDLHATDEQQPKRSDLETWPRLPGQAPSRLTHSMRTMSIGSVTPSINGTEMSASEFASDITSRRGTKKVQTESYPSINSPMTPSSINGDDDSTSVATSTIASSINTAKAWTTGHSSQALFKDAKPTPPPGEWDAIEAHLEKQNGRDRTTNLFYSRFWDPYSPDYNINQFYLPVIQRYYCPFADCGDLYDEPRDVEGHIRNAHLKTSYRCPLCLKLFKSAYALVSHSEAGGRCKVKKSSMYDKLLDEISGGYLKAEHLREPKVYKPETALVKAGDRIDGVMDTKFVAKLPEDR